MPPTKLLVKASELSILGNKLLVSSMLSDVTGFYCVDVVAVRQEMKGVCHENNSFSFGSQRAEYGSVEEGLSNMRID